MFLLVSFLQNFLHFNANSVDPDQTPRFVANDLSLQRLPFSLVWDTMIGANGLKRRIDIWHTMNANLQNVNTSTLLSHGHHENMPI